MDKSKKQPRLKKFEFSYKSNYTKSGEAGTDEFWKDCNLEKTDKQLSTMQDSNRDNNSVLSSLRSGNNSGRNLSQPQHNSSKKAPKKRASNNEIKEPNLSLEKMYANLINNLSEDVVNIKNIKRDVKKEKSERYHSAGSSADSVITFTEKKEKRANHSMDTKKDRIMNSSLMSIKDEEARVIKKNLRAKQKQASNNLYMESQKKKEKLNLKAQEYEKQKLEKEQEMCTFKPKINEYKKSSTKATHFDLYERTKKWKQSNAEKLEKSKQQSINSNLNECSFKPSINHKTLSHREEADTIKDKETLRFIKRISDAKKTKEEKNARLCPDINERYEKLFRRNKINTLQPGNDSGLNSEYCTFNPQKKPNDYAGMRKLLKQELNSLMLTRTEEDENI